MTRWGGVKVWRISIPDRCPPNTKLCARFAKQFFGWGVGQSLEGRAVADRRVSHARNFFWRGMFDCLAGNQTFQRGRWNGHNSHAVSTDRRIFCRGLLNDNRRSRRLVRRRLARVRALRPRIHAPATTGAARGLLLGRVPHRCSQGSAARLPATASAAHPGGRTDAGVPHMPPGVARSPHRRPDAGLLQRRMSPGRHRRAGRRAGAGEVERIQH